MNGPVTRPIRLHHTAYVSKDLEATRRFYEQYVRASLKSPTITNRVLHPLSWIRSGTENGTTSLKPWREARHLGLHASNFPNASRYSACQRDSGGRSSTRSLAAHRMRRASSAVDTSLSGQII